MSPSEAGPDGKARSQAGRRSQPMAGMRRIAVRPLVALAWLTTMSLLSRWANTTAALETALAVTTVAGLLVGAPDWKRAEAPRPATAIRRITGAAIGLLAVAATVIGLINLLYAMIFVSGYEQVPNSTTERVLWLLIPALTVSAGGWAVREAYRYPTNRWRAKRYLTALLGALLASAAWWCLAALLRG